MELHSYAKRKASKKWTIEQKRKLVEARISYDAIFTNKATNSVVPWKKILSLAKLDDYNVFFVRKQWSNMISKYKQYKQNRLGNIPSRAIDDETIHKITHEWEFFYPIHRFMTRKTNNLHSYALTTAAVGTESEPVSKQGTAVGQKEIPKPMPSSPLCATETVNHESNEMANKELQQPSQFEQHNSNSSIERINNIFSSDTNEDYNSCMAARSKDLQALNTDHDFYTKKNVKQLTYFSDDSEDTQESMIVEFATVVVNGHETETVERDYINKTVTGGFGNTKNNLQKPPTQNSNTEKQQNTIKIEIDSDTVASCSRTERKPTSHIKTPQLSERDKYYRHKRRFNHRLERRFDSILNVFGQIVKAEYPSIDVSALTGVAKNVTNNVASTFVNKLFSSGESDDDDDYETDNNVAYNGGENGEMQK